MTSERLGDQGRLLGTVALLFLIAWYTDEIGLYAVFGAFVLGVIMPRGERTDRVGRHPHPGRRDRVPAAVLHLLRPADRVRPARRPARCCCSRWPAWCWRSSASSAPAGARPGCAANRTAVALRVGALMNARGLMQLIALNVGLDAGIVNSALFTVLVLVALVTTIMTSPLLTCLDRRAGPPVLSRLSTR